MADYLKSKNFTPDNVFHGFFGRVGGVGSGLYDSLNICGYSNDDRDIVQKNRDIISKKSGCGKLHILKQTHSNICLKIDAEQDWDIETPPEGDALVTDKKGVLIGVQTADCVPVLFFGEKADGSPVIGATHAGWGGALKGVLENTCNSMVEIGAISESIRASIGPSIQCSSYEVGKEFAVPFIENNEEAERFFKAGRNKDKLNFDLSAYVSWRLSVVGLKQIIDCGIDTYSNKDKYFSFRRSFHNGDSDYGRQGAVIGIVD